MLKMSNLKNCFDAAEKENAKFIGVLVQIKDNKSRELIVNERASFGAKLAYYQATYDEELNHKHAPGIKIVGFTQADNLKEMEQLF